MENREKNRRIASRGGYFWLPCPLCGQMFGGHEWMVDQNKYVPTIPDPNGPVGAGIGICPDCTVAGKGHYGRKEPVTAHVQIYTSEIDAMGYKWRARVLIDSVVLGECLDRTEEAAIAQARTFADMKIKAMRDALKPDPEPRLAVNEHVEL